MSVINIWLSVHLSTKTGVGKRSFNNNNNSNKNLCLFYVLPYDARVLQRPPCVHDPRAVVIVSYYKVKDRQESLWYRPRGYADK